MLESRNTWVSRITWENYFSLQDPAKCVSILKTNSSTTTGETATINFEFQGAADDGTVTIFCSDTNMRSVDPGRYFYDLQYKVGSTTKTVLKGSFIINDDVSKATN